MDWRSGRRTDRQALRRADRDERMEGWWQAADGWMAINGRMDGDKQMGGGMTSRRMDGDKGGRMVVRRTDGDKDGLMVVKAGGW